MDGIVWMLQNYISNQ